jgi:CRP/FNR family transcriptional regulator
LRAIAFIAEALKMVKKQATIQDFLCQELDQGNFVADGLTIENVSRTRNHFADSPEWCTLSDVSLKKVSRAARYVHLDVGDYIFHEGDECRGVYLLEEGLIAVRKNGYEGHVTLLKIATPGDTLGYRPLLAEQPHRASADALAPSTICFIDAATCRELIRDNPALGLNFLKRAAQELGNAEARFHDTVSLTVQSRFAHLLAVLKDHFGEIDDAGVLHLDLPVSRTDLAEMLGVRRESISRVIHELEERGISKFRDRHVEVPNPDELLSEFVK